MLRFMLLCVVLLSSCGDPAKPPAPTAVVADPVDTVQGRRYLDDLARAIDAADEIVVTEHSWRYDVREAASLPPPPQTIIYGTRVLSAEQKAAFATLVRQLPTATQDAFPACMFEPHHTFDFRRGGKTVDTMQVCFLCGQVEWQGTTATPPWSLYTGLATFVTSIGLTPERDWAALATGASRGSEVQPSSGHR